MASRGLLGWGLALGWAAGAWGQALKPLEYSRKVMDYDGPMHYNPDTILIRNPNAIDLRCDSIEMLLGQTQLYGLHVFRKILHVRGMEDTLSMSIHRRFTVGLGRPKILKASPEEPEGRPVLDLLGRRWAPWRASGIAVRAISP